MNSSALVPFKQSSFIARRNFFNFLGITCRILSSTNELLFVAKLKAFKLKEDITLFRDAARTEPVLSIKARQILDFGATYDVRDAASGESIGAYRRKGLRSILRDEWEILDKNEGVIGTIQEDSQLLALLRRLLSSLIAQSYTVSVLGEQIGTLKGTWNPFIVKYRAHFREGYENTLDPRMVLAGTILLLAIEGKQS